MSEIIKSTFVNYMICAVVGGIFEYLAPERSRKTLRIVLVAVILTVTLSPVLKTEIDFGFAEESEISEDIGYDALMHTRNLTEKKIRAEMKEIIINAGIDEYEIYITTDADESTYTVYLDKVEIQVGKEYIHLAELIKNNAPEEYRSVVEVGVKDDENS